MHQGAAFRQPLAAAVKCEAAERNGFRVLGREQRWSVRVDQPGGAADAGKLRTGRQRKTAGAIDAGREHQRDARARGLVDGALQGGALVASGTRTHAEMPCVEAEGRQRRGFRRRGEGSGAKRAEENGPAVESHPAQYAPIAHGVC